MGFQGSTLYQSWASQLRLRWLSVKGRAQALAYATVLGDWTSDWIVGALLERMPLTASSPAVSLMASERQMDTQPGEPTPALAARETQWIALGRYAGTPLGILLGLHFSGYDGAVLVQQNGVAYHLMLPLPPIVVGQPWDPSPNIVRTACIQLANALTSNVTPPTVFTAGRKIPAGNSWWTFDSNTDFCSRFAILFPSVAASFANFSTTGRATFTASQSATLSWSTPMATGSPTAYYVMVGPAVVTDGGGFVSVTADMSSESTLGTTINASGPFTGYVDASSFGVTISDLLRLQATIKKWRPARAICVGIYAVVQGQMFGWPIQTWGSRPSWGPFTAAVYPGA